MYFVPSNPVGVTLMIVCGYVRYQSVGHNIHAINGLENFACPMFRG